MAEPLKPATSGPETTLPPRDAVAAELEKILASKVFINANRLSALLRHVVEQTLDGNAGGLREYQLGVDVFGRKESYDPRADPVVRVEARQLRFKLEAYYQEFGQADEIVISLPKGRYVARFDRRDRLDTAAASPEAEGSDVQPPQAGAAGVLRPGRRMAFAVMGTALVLGITAWAFLTRIARVENRSIAVLPFTNLSTDPANEYFSDGLTDEVTDALARTRGLRVIARSSAFRFKGKTVDVREVGRELGVTHVLEGSVERSGDRIKVIAHLERVSDGSQEWSRTFERQSSDLFAVQSELAEGIARNLNAAAAPVARHVPSDEVYRLAIEGRYEEQQMTPQAVANAEAKYRRAIELDPDYAAAYALLASAINDDYTARGGTRGNEDASKTIGQLLRRAIELDPTDSGAHVLLAAQMMQYNWDWIGAEKELRLARSEGPTAVGETYFAFLLCFHGRFAEADEHLKLAQVMDPLGVATLTNSANIRNLEGHFAEALESFRKLGQLAPSSPLAPTMISLTYIEQGRPEAALPQIRELEKRFPQYAMFEAMAQARAGHREEALRLMRPFEDQYPNTAPAMQWFALVYGFLGDEPDTVKWLERSADRHEFQAMNLAVHPVFAPMRNSPGFQALRKRMGLDR